MSGVTWAALQAKQVRVGMYPNGLGVFVYQMEGNTLMCCGDLVELCSARNPNFAEMMKFEAVAMSTDYKQLIEDCDRVSKIIIIFVYSIWKLLFC